MMRVDESKMVLAWEGYCLQRRDPRVPTPNHRTEQHNWPLPHPDQGQAGDQELGGPTRRPCSFLT